MSERTKRTVKAGKKYQQFAAVKRQAVRYEKRGIRRAERRASQCDAAEKSGSSNSGGVEHG
jgi:hypothetical protein